MRIAKIVAIALATQFASGMALAQTETPKAASGHHYQGGPKTTVPHHMQDMQDAQDTKGKTTGSTAKPKVSHGYQGGPQSPVPHTMGK